MTGPPKLIDPILNPWVHGGIFNLILGGWDYSKTVAPCPLNDPVEAPWLS
jgi:hypothetical protein